MSCFPTALGSLESGKETVLPPSGTVRTGSQCTPTTWPSSSRPPSPLQGPHEQHKSRTDAPLNKDSKRPCGRTSTSLPEEIAGRCHGGAGEVWVGRCQVTRTCSGGPGAGVRACGIPSGYSRTRSSVRTLLLALVCFDFINTETPLTVRYII